MMTNKEIKRKIRLSNKILKLQKEQIKLLKKNRSLLKQMGEEK